MSGFAFFISADGYASVRPHAGGVVHGLGWDLAFRDVAALDRYEAVETGLYSKEMLPVRFSQRTCQALVYVGRSLVAGAPVDGYLEPVIAAAIELALPDTYIAVLRRWLPGGGRPGTPGNARSAHRGGRIVRRP